MSSRLRQVVALARQRPYRITHASALGRDVLRLPYLRWRDPYKFSGDTAAGSNVEHLVETMAWLARAQDADDDAGVSAGYSLRSGWAASYPETTGYIIPTCFDFAAFSGDVRYRARAVRMANWLLSIQLDEGAFQAGTVDLAPRPSVFNTGQIVLGLVRAFGETRDEAYLLAAERAADWIASVQDPDGAWRAFSYRDVPHVYYVRVAWALLELDAAAGSTARREAALRNLTWALQRQEEDGWFRENAFDGGGVPVSHTIVYAAEGFLGAGRLLEEEIFVDAAADVGAALARKFEVEKVLRAEFGPGWRSDARYVCLTGVAQLSGLLIDLFEQRRDETRVNTALKLNEYLRSTQVLESRDPGIRGGVKGSDPIWGSYLTYAYPNWAAKFAADAYLAEERVLALLAEGP